MEFIRTYVENNTRNRTMDSNTLIQITMLFQKNQGDFQQSLQYLPNIQHWK